MAMNHRLLRPRASGGGFDPRSISGLEAWWDAADASSVTLDSGRVSEWRDKSGKARHAVNSTSGSTQPDYVASARNGRNVVRFTAALTQRLTVPSSTGTFSFLHKAQGGYVLAVSKYGTSDNPSANLGLFGNNANASANHGVFAEYDDRDTPGFNNTDALASTITRGVTGQFTASTFNSTSTTLLADYRNVFTPQSYHVQDLLFAGGETASQRLRLRVDGGVEKAANEFSNTASTANASFDLQLGASGNNANPLEGDICEFLIFSELPTELARDALRSYLATKWGVTLA